MTKRKAESSLEDDSGSKRAKTSIQGSASIPEREQSSKLANKTPNTKPEEQVHAEGSKDEGKSTATKSDLAQKEKPKQTYRKLAPPRPFPTVPTSVSATGPRSAHVEGKNYICITRKTPLGAYLRRCKDAILKDGHKTLHLSAMGAAIPHLAQLAVALPDILPYAPGEIRTETLTGTMEVHDEVIPEDEDEDISYRTRGKSTLSVVITIGDGVDEGSHTGKGRQSGNRGRGSGRGGSKGNRQDRRQAGKNGEKGRADDDMETGTVVVRAEDVEGD